MLMSLINQTRTRNTHGGLRLIPCYSKDDLLRLNPPPGCNPTSTYGPFLISLRNSGVI